MRLSHCSRKRLVMLSEQASFQTADLILSIHWQKTRISVPYHSIMILNALHMGSYVGISVFPAEKDIVGAELVSGTAHSVSIPLA